MRVFLTGFFVILMTCGMVLPAAHAADTADTAQEGFGPDGFANLAEHLLPSVVNISSTQKPVETQDFPDMPHFPPGSPFEDFFEEFMDRRGHGMPAIPPASLGSGFIIDAEKGYT